MRELSIKHAKPPGETWVLRASESGLELEHGGGRHVVPADELAKRGWLIDGVLLRGKLSLALEGRAGRDAFDLDDASTTELLRGLGPELAVRWQLAQRTRWFVPLAIIFLVTALPIPGVADAGIVPLPADWLGGFLGLGLLVLAGAAKYRPQAWLFVFDAGWVFLLVASGIADVASGTASPFWLLLYAFLVTAGLGDLRLYRRLRAIGAPE